MLVAAEENKDNSEPIVKYQRRSLDHFYLILDQKEVLLAIWFKVGVIKE